MKKLTAMLLALAMLLACGMALAEGAENKGALCGIEEGGYVVRIPVEDGDQGWYAESGDEAVARLAGSGVEGDAFTARFEAVADGTATVTARHFYCAAACDAAYTWDLKVAEGVIQDATGGSFTQAPDPAEQDALLSGDWSQEETQFTRMTVARNENRGWDVEIVSPATHGAYVFRANVNYDCYEDAFVYDKGKFFEAPITDDEQEGGLGEIIAAGTTGALRFVGGEGEMKLAWRNDQTDEPDIVFVRDAVVDTEFWQYYTFEGSAVAMKLPQDFQDGPGAPEADFFYNCGNDDVLLQVNPAEGDFEDLEALAADFDRRENVLSATQETINGVALVHVQYADDAQTYAVISPEGTTYCFAFIPRSDNGGAVTQAIASTLCFSDSIPFESATVAPMGEKLDLENLSDGDYPAAFARANLADGALTMEVYTEDWYDIVDINRLKEGDTLVVAGKAMPVETIGREDDLIINGGLDAGGCVLRAEEESNGYRIVDYNDLSSYTLQGSATLPLDEGVRFTDAWDIQGEPQSFSGAAAVAEAIAATENDDFDAYNTVVSVEGGRIVAIARNYTP